MGVEKSVAKEAIKQFVVVNLGAEQYGINIQSVQNIVRMMKITRVPKAKDHIKGVVNLRGEIIPVMSVRLKLKLEEGEISDNTRILFVKVDGNEIGLIVDEIIEVVQLTKNDIDIIHQDAGEVRDNYVYGVGKVGDALVTLLNVEGLVNDNDVSKG